MVGNSSLVLSRVLGFGGSSSRMIRSISSNAASLQPLALERRGAGQQLVEQHAQRIDVAAGVDVELVELGLLGAHVLDRADHLAELGEHRPFGELLAVALATPKSITFGTGLVVVLGDQHVRWA